MEIPSNIRFVIGKKIQISKRKISPNEIVAWEAWDAHWEELKILVSITCRHISILQRLPFLPAIL